MAQFHQIHCLKKCYPLQNILVLDEHSFATTCGLQSFIERFTVSDQIVKHHIKTNNKSITLNSYTNNHYCSQNMDSVYMANDNNSFGCELTSGFFLSQTMALRHQDYVNLSSDDQIRVINVNFDQAKLKVLQNIKINYEGRFPTQLVPMVVLHQSIIGFKSGTGKYSEYDLEYGYQTCSKWIGKNEVLKEVLSIDQNLKYFLTNEFISIYDSRTNKICSNISSVTNSNCVRVAREHQLAYDHQQNIEIYDIRAQRIDRLGMDRSGEIKTFQFVGQDIIVLITKENSELQIYKRK